MNNIKDERKEAIKENYERAKKNGFGKSEIEDLERIEKNINQFINDNGIDLFNNIAMYHLMYVVSENYFTEMNTLIEENEEKYYGLKEHISLMRNKLSERTSFIKTKNK